MARPKDEYGPEDLQKLFEDHPMLARHFVEIGERLKNPWFRLRFYFLVWRERIRSWLGRG